VFYFCFIDAKQRLNVSQALNPTALRHIRFAFEVQK